MKVIVTRNSKIIGCIDINLVKFLSREMDKLCCTFTDGETFTLTNLKEQDFDYVFKQVKAFNDNQNLK